MTLLLDAIEGVLRRGLVHRGRIVLQETATKSTCKPIELHKDAQPWMHAVTLQPDLVGSDGISVQDRLFPLFDHFREGIAVMCDYIVFCQDMRRQNRLFVLHCELKSNNPGGSRQQIENGRLLADYIVEMAKYHAGLRDVPVIERRGLLFWPGGSVPMGNLFRKQCEYACHKDGFEDLQFAHYRDNNKYPLIHFCA